MFGLLIVMAMANWGANLLIIRLVTSSQNFQTLLDIPFEILIYEKICNDVYRK
jgi:hypothetical protein